MGKGLDASNKEKNLLTVLELALEMCERGFSFQNIDLYRSSANEFIIDGNSLIPPFNSIPGLGTNAAFNIVKAREEGEFLSKEDLQQRGKVSKTILEFLDNKAVLNLYQIRINYLYFKRLSTDKYSILFFVMSSCSGKGSRS